MKDQVEQLNEFGDAASAIGIEKEAEKNRDERMTQFPSSTCFVPNRSRVSRFVLPLGVLPCRV